MNTPRHKHTGTRQTAAIPFVSFMLSIVLIVVAVAGTAHTSWAAIPTSDDLSRFLTDVSISGITPDAQGVYRYRDGDEATLRFTFAEDDTVQFADSQLSYDLPQGFDAVNVSGTFDVPVVHAGAVYTVKGNTWRIQDGKLIISWNSADPNIGYLRSSANTRIVLGVKFTLHGVQGKIKLADGVERTFELDTSNDLAVSKTSAYDEKTGRVHYTVNIASTGTSTDVKVSDTISGTAIAYDPSSLRVSGNSGTYTVHTDGNGFVFTAPTMANKETITITYDGVIDYSAFKGSVTADNTRNTVTATSDGDPDPRKNTVTTDESHTIHLTDLSKTGTTDTTGGGASSRTVHWTLNANNRRLVSLAGGSIGDSIDQASRQRMSYAGDGVSIDVIDAAGRRVETRKVTWKQLGVTDPSTTKEWKYQVPSTDGVYSYLITYDTTVDTSGTLTDLSVGNSASTDSPATGRQSTNTSVSVGKEFDLETHKSVVADRSDYHHTTWKIDASVPAAGYNSLTVTDTLPSIWGTVPDGAGNQVSKMLYDAYVDGSLTVEGLLDGESYTLDTSDPAKVTVTFYQDAAHTRTGLRSSSAARTIALTLQTRNNEDWLALGKDGGWQATHTNAETVTANGQKKNASASTVPVRQTITKKSEYAGTRTINGTDLPIYRYTLMLEGVNSDSLDIDDEFDTSLFSFATTQQVGVWDQNRVYGGDQYWQGAQGYKPITWTYTDKGVTIHVPSGAIDKRGGAYYPRYRIVYYLIAKDADALRTLNQRATDNNGTTTFTNTAKWNGSSTGSIVSTYTYKTVTKEQTSVDPKTRIASFRLNLNPKGTDINPNGNTLMLEDTMSANMIPDVTSLHADPSDGVMFHLNPDTNVLSIVFPDQTPVTITYNAYLKGNGRITYSNKASLYGQTSDITNTTDISSESSSSASVPSIRLLKNDSGNLGEPLAGARFKLYRASDDTPVTDTEFVTGADGIAVISGRQDQDGWALKDGVRYYLVETSAPDGYEKRSDRIYFTITDKPSGTDEYPDSYTIPWSNTPRRNKTSIAIHKVDAANSATGLPGARFELMGFGLTLNATTTSNGTARFEGLEPGTYTLTEIQAPDGYQTPSSGHTIMVADDLTVTYDGRKLEPGAGEPPVITITNQRKRFFLPETGRLGGLWLLMGAGGLALSAGSLLMLADTRPSRQASSRGRHGRGKGGRMR